MPCVGLALEQVTLSARLVRQPNTQSRELQPPVSLPVWTLQPTTTWMGQCAESAIPSAGRVLEQGAVSVRAAPLGSTW